MRQHFLTFLTSLILLLGLSTSLIGQNCISGTVYEDINNNGIQEAGEGGLGNLSVYSVNSSGQLDQALTDNQGFYEFCAIEDGDYSIYLLLDDPLLSVQPSSYFISFFNNEDNTGNDFGIVGVEVLSSLSGKAYIGYNDNGEQDPFEPALVGYEVHLTGQGGIDELATTDQFGQFQFLGLSAGEYMVTIMGSPLNTEWLGGESMTFGLSVGEDVNDIEFVLISAGGFTGVYDRVCYDLNSNGQNEPDLEPAIGGVGVILINDVGEEVQSTASDGNGIYGFVGVTPGVYTVRVIYDAEEFEPTTPTEYIVDPTLGQPIEGGFFYFNPLTPRFDCGMAVHSYGVTFNNGTTALAVWDTRDRTTALLGTNWIGVSKPYSWTLSQIGRVRGIAIGNNFDIYLSALGGTTYAAGSGGVLKIDATTLAVSTITSLPNTGIGLGNLCFNNQLNSLLYVTNLEDGSITVIRISDGATLQTYVPFSVSEKPFGIAYNKLENRLYFSVEGAGGTTRPLSTIYSLTLDATGLIVVTDPIVSEVNVPVLNPHPTNPSLATNDPKPLWDIAFSHDYKEMLCAERSTHRARVLLSASPSGLTTTWSAPTHIVYGTNTTDAAGGVDFAYESIVAPDVLPTGCENYIVGTSDALQFSSGTYTYGFGISPPGGGAYSNYVFIDNDGFTTTSSQSKGRAYDVEIFDCDCLFEPIDCASSHGLDILPASPEDPAGVGDCCHVLDFNNTGQFDVYGISLSLLDGVEFQNTYQIAPGYYAPNFNASSMTITPNALGVMPTNINGVLNFCLENIYAVPQYMVIDYLDEDYNVFCSDTLTFECPLQSECLEFTLDSLVCDTLGYKYTVDFIVPPGTDFDIGFIKFSLTQNLPAGSSVEPIGPNADVPNEGHVFSPALMPGDMVSLMYIIHTSDILFEDSLCVIITAHDDLEERLCCFAYENCIPYPYCPMPCDDVEARVIPNYQGEAADYCNGDPRNYNWLQDLIGDCAALPCGAVVSTCMYQGAPVIVIEDDGELCSDSFGTVYDCQGVILFQYGGIGGINFDLHAQLSGCTLIYDCYQPTNDECCFDLLITDTYVFDPALITAIQTTIITPGVSFTGQSRLNAILNGWIPNDLVVDQDILWTHNSGATPNGIDDYLFTFCIEGTISTDSVYIEVDWLNQDSVICQDTVAVFCPYCLQVVNDSLSCITDAMGNQSYLYQFSFINSSAFDVNAVYVGDQGDFPDPQDTVLNAGVQMLGMIVPPGATYTGLIPVQLDPSLDSACFDIVLRQIIGDSINISCCYATHCIELPPCDSLPQISCPDPGLVQELNCTDNWDPVCGCDGQTYSNICYAQSAGIALWDNGPCDNFNDIDGNISLGGQIVTGGAQLNWMISDSPDNYAFFVVLRRGAGELDYQELAIIPTNGEQQYNYLDVNAEAGLNSYQIIGALTSGLASPSNQVELFLTETLGLQATIYAFPSPATETVNVTVNKVGQAQLQLISPDGQVHFQEQAFFNGTPHPVNVSDLTDGVFIVRLNFDDGETAQQRVVKMK